jgi:hypothetical protein
MKLRADETELPKQTGESAEGNAHLGDSLWKGKETCQAGTSKVLQMKRYLPPFTILTRIRVVKTVPSATMPLL